MGLDRHVTDLHGEGDHRRSTRRRRKRPIVEAAPGTDAMARQGNAEAWDEHEHGSIECDLVGYRCDRDVVTAGHEGTEVARTDPVKHEVRVTGAARNGEPLALRFADCRYGSHINLGPTRHVQRDKRCPRPDRRSNNMRAYHCTLLGALFERQRIPHYT